VKKWEMASNILNIIPREIEDLNNNSRSIWIHIVREDHAATTPAIEIPTSET